MSDCPKQHWVRTTGQDGTPSQRRIRCCVLRHGFMIKHWKCLGREHPECPLNKKENDNG